MDNDQRKELVEIIGMGKDIHYIKEAFKEFKDSTGTSLDNINRSLNSIDDQYVKKVDYIRTIEWAEGLKKEADGVHEKMWKAINRNALITYGITAGITLLGFLIATGIIHIPK